MSRLSSLLHVRQLIRLFAPAIGSLVIQVAVVATLYFAAARWFAPLLSGRGLAPGVVTSWSYRAVPLPFEPTAAGTDLAQRSQTTGIALLAEAGAHSASLVLLSCVSATVLAVPIGFWLATRAPRRLVAPVLAITSLGVALPAFFVVFLLQVVVVEVAGRVGHTVLPVYGYGLDSHLIIPAVALTLTAWAYITRFVVLSASDLAANDFVRTARGKGLNEWEIVRNHIAPNMIGVVAEAVLGGFRIVIGGLVVVEYLVVWPGLGVLALRALNAQDPGLFIGSSAILGAVLLGSTVAIDYASRRSGRQHA